MANEVKVVAFTKESTDVATMNEDMTIFSGKAAGVCYMPDDYLSNGIQDSDKALKRAKGTAKSGHHSVFDHAHITFIINTNKMMAMTLNSLGVYTTSEKSARYTKMHPETELESDLYKKWTDIIKDKIRNKYPWIDDKFITSKLKKEYTDREFKVVAAKVYAGRTTDIDRELTNYIETKILVDDTLPSAKLATENARYMISVFTPTTMMYTMSFRQSMLTIDYLRKLADDCSKNTGVFYKRLRENAIELANSFENAIGEMRIHDNKNQSIRLFENCDENKPMNKTEVIGDSYTLRYKASLACLAQLHRHRTIRYTMFMGKQEDMEFYVPEIIKDSKLEKEWLTDIKSVSYCIPQGTLVDITEQGIFEDYALKCKERLCGRAQLEITRLTANNIKKFVNHKDSLCENNRLILSNMYEKKDNGEIVAVARCRFKDFKCTEGCTWGSGEYLDRLI